MKSTGAHNPRRSMLIVHMQKQCNTHDIILLRSLVVSLIGCLVQYIHGCNTHACAHVPIQPSKIITCKWTPYTASKTLHTNDIHCTLCILHIFTTLHVVLDQSSDTSVTAKSTSNAAICSLRIRRCLIRNSWASTGSYNDTRTRINTKREGEIYVHLYVLYLHCFTVILCSVRIAVW